MEKTQNIPFIACWTTLWPFTHMCEVSEDAFCISVFTESSDVSCDSPTMPLFVAFVQYSLSTISNGVTCLQPWAIAKSIFSNLTLWAMTFALSWSDNLHSCVSEHTVPRVSCGRRRRSPLAALWAVQWSAHSLCLLTHQNVVEVNIATCCTHDVSLQVACCETHKRYLIRSPPLEIRICFCLTVSPICI